MTKQPAKRPRGRPPVGKQAMTAAERHARYMARLRARAAKGAEMGFKAEQVGGIMEYVAQARDGMITARQLVAKIGRVAGVKLKP